MKTGDISKRPIKVFLSHSEADSGVARKVRDQLTHYSTSSVFTNADLSAGENWQAKLERELKRADVFIAVLTPQAVSSNWVLQELGAAWSLEKPIIAVVTDFAMLDRFPIRLRGYQAFKIGDLDTTKGLDRFVKAIEQAPALLPTA